MLFALKWCLYDTSDVLRIAVNVMCPGICLGENVRSTTYLAPDKRNLVTLILFPQSHERWTVSLLHTECGALTAGS